MVVGQPSLFEQVGAALAALTHLPNRQPCPHCHDGTVPPLGEVVARWLGVSDEARPCPSCKGTGARHCDYACGRLAVAFDIAVGRFVCEVCATLGDEPAVCCACTWSRPDEVELGGGASASVGFWHRACGRFCCSEACVEEHERTCSGTPAVPLAAVLPDTPA